MAMQQINARIFGQYTQLVVALFILLLSNSVQSKAIEDNSLRPFLAKYKGFMYGISVGEASISLESTGNKEYKLSYRSKASMFLMSDRRSETSLFSLNDNGFTPHSYTYRRKGTGRKKGVDVVFDEQNKRIHIDDKDTYPWQGELDNQLFRLDIQRRLSKGETDFFYKLVNDRGLIREYSLKTLGKEQLELPYGKLEGIKVEIVRDAQNRRKTYVWFSPELDFQLVRLQQFKDGKEQGDIRLSHFEINS